MLGTEDAIGPITGLEFQQAEKIKDSPIKREEDVKIIETEEEGEMKGWHGVWKSWAWKEHLVCVCVYSLVCL